MANFEPQSRFYLIKDVDIDISYNHQYYFFDTPAQQYNFFYSKVFKTVEGGTYQRKELGVIQLPFEADDIKECKYIMWQNANYTDKWYYAFVNAVRYVNPNVSTIVYTVDIFQTYYFEVKNAWKTSFFERKHCDRWTSEGLPVVNTIPEGLEYGSSYRTLARYSAIQQGDVSFVVIGMKEKLDSPTLIDSISNLPTVLSYYIVPVALNNTRYQFKVNGTYVDNVFNVLRAIYTSEEYTDKTVSCYLMPYLPDNNSNLSFDMSQAGYCNIVDTNFRTVTFTVGSTTYTVMRAITDFIPRVYETNFRYRKNGVTYTKDNKYNNLPTYEESKLLMHPYTFEEMATDRGGVLVIRNEFLNSKGITVGCFGTITQRNKFAYALKNYLNSGLVNGWEVDTTANGYNFEYAINDSSSEELPIIDEYTASYLQSNRNSISVAEKNAEMTLINSRVAAFNRRAISKNAMWTDLGNSIADTAYSTFLGASGGGIQDNRYGSFHLNSNGKALLGGALVDVGTAAMTALSRNMAANTNYAIDTATAQTSYDNTMRTIQGKIQDTENIPDNVMTMGNEYTFDIAFARDGCYLYDKTILPEYAARLTDYFRKFGYTVNGQFDPAREFVSRENWNYVKIPYPINTANIPQEDLMVIKDIFMKGITLWHGDYIGNYDLANNEVNGNPYINNGMATVSWTVTNGSASVYYRDATGDHNIQNGASVPINTRLYIWRAGDTGSLSQPIIVNGCAIPNEEFTVRSKTNIEITYIK